MISTVFAISAAYAVLALLLLAFCLRSDFAWRVKAAAIVVGTLFCIEAFFATRGLLSYPSPGKLPGRFQLLWARVVEPDPKSADPGAIFLWVEELDANNIPDGLPRAFRLPYTRPLAETSGKARDAIMAGNPQEGTAEELSAASHEASKLDTASSAQTLSLQANDDGGNTNLDFQFLGQSQGVEFKPLPPPLLPPKT
jgi:hypothetical protein